MRDVLNARFIGADYIQETIAAYENKGGLQTAFKVAARQGHWSPVTVTYISDNGGYPDLASAEINLNIHDINRVFATLTETLPPLLHAHDIPSQDWRAGAFDLAQLSRYRLTGPGNVIFVNCAPRLAQRGKDTDNKGENVYVGMLKNGTIVSGVSPHSFAFFRDLIERGELEVHQVNVQTKGSQFRSRDFFPWFTQALSFGLSQPEAVSGWKKDLSTLQRSEFLGQFGFIDTAKVLTLDDIVDLRRPQVVRVDTHGNLKLSVSRDDLPEDYIGRPLIVTIKGRQYHAEVRDHMFDNSTDRSGVAPGSSGQWPDSDKADPRFLEIALMGKSMRGDAALTDQDLKEGVYIEISLDDHDNVRHLPVQGQQGIQNPHDDERALAR